MASTNASCYPEGDSACPAFAEAHGTTGIVVDPAHAHEFSDNPQKRFGTSGDKRTTSPPSPVDRPLFCDAIRQRTRSIDALRISYIIAVAILILQLWALSVTFLGHDAFPNGQLFRLLVLCIVGQIVGWIVHVIADAPPLVGMLMVGVAMRSSGYLVISGVYHEVVVVIRSLALAVLMTEAGLSIRAETLRRMSLLVLGLVVIPATGEVVAVTGLAYLILDMPWLWGALLGVVLCAVAPSVVMPSFLQLRKSGLGADKGIDALLLAAASLDDVLAVSIFGLLIGIIFESGSSATKMSLHFVGLLLGAAYGGFVGIVLQYVPSPKLDDSGVVRSMLLVGAGILAIFGLSTVGFLEGGPTACIVAGCIAGTWWRRRNFNQVADETTRHVGILWSILQVPMFGLIGADVDTSLLGKDDAYKAIVVIVGGLVVRGLCTYILMLTSNFSWKEKVFITLAWLPKADVQAALGPLALDLVRQQVSPNDGDERHALNLLVVAIVSILLTAPAGAAVITTLGKRLLKPPEPQTPVMESVSSIALTQRSDYGSVRVRADP